MSLIQRVITLAAAGAAAATLTALLAPLGWPFELVGHFKPQIAFGALACLAAAVILKRQGGRIGKPAFAAFGAAALINGAVLFFPGEIARPVGGSGEVRLVWINLHRSSDALDRVAAATDADIVLLTELPFARLAELAQVYPDHPHRLFHGAPGVWGTRDVALISRLPLRRDAALSSPLAGHSVLAAIVEGDRPFAIFAAHPFPPATPRHLAQRDGVMTAIGEAAARIDLPYVIAGDFNATPWTPGYHLLPGRRAGDPRLASTWFARAPLIGLPIDHVMLSDGIVPHEARVLQDVGSDHFPLLVEISLSPEG
ncbi:MAG: endonuclease/exonuclease/phosphatase family protein [Pseudomonadota bacterium]